MVDRVETVDVTVSVPGARVCQENGCVTVLSQYNSTAWCGLHSRRDWRASREPRRRNGAGSPSGTAAAESDDTDW